MTEKILPIPCMKVEKKTVKDWFQKINEEMDELKEAVMNRDGGLDYDLRNKHGQTIEADKKNRRRSRRHHNHYRLYVRGYGH